MADMMEKLSIPRKLKVDEPLPLLLLKHNLTWTHLLSPLQEQKPNVKQNLDVPLCHGMDTIS